jgi:hypothetical protein
LEDPDDSAFALPGVEVTTNELKNLLTSLSRLALADGKAAFSM